MSYHLNVYMDDFSRYQSCRIPAVSAMEMVFKCGRTEIEYRAALELRQNPSSLYHHLDHDGSGNRLYAPERMINAPVRRGIYLDNCYS